MNKRTESFNSQNRIQDELRPFIKSPGVFIAAVFKKQVGFFSTGRPRRCLALTLAYDQTALRSSFPWGGMDSTTVYVLLVILVATLIRSAFGFGEALVAVPLLAIRIPISVAAPLAVLVSITVAAVIIAQDWRHIHLRSAGWLVTSTLFGIPLGLVLLTHGDHRLVKGTLAVIIMAFSAYALIGRKPPELHSDNRIWLLICGFCAGILGGAYGMNGPPLAIYGAMRRWTAQHFRATLQGYFLPASVIGMLGYWLAGLWVPTVTHYYLLSLPLVVPAILLGRAVNRRMRGGAFLKVVHLGLILIGTTLLVQAIRG